MHGGLPFLEEADNRIVLHARGSIDRRMNKILVRTVDSDVVVILVSFLAQLLEKDSDTQIYVDFGVSNNRRLIKVNECYEYIEKINSLALPFFHAFSGCDSTRRVR